jgi:D-3-phosphoglycerate dehydrogenase / 2-oxoglutarate reductase
VGRRWPSSIRHGSQIADEPPTGLRDSDSVGPIPDTTARTGTDTMKARVVLLDPAGEIGYVERALVGVPGLRIERAERVPCGPGIVALLVPPEVAVGANDVAQLPDLRIVAATSTGYDHLELDALAAAGVWATHCPGYCDEEVAEHAVALALGLLRGVTGLDRGVRAGCWDWRVAPPRPVSGAVLAIVGLGRIGREVAWRARGLGMHVTAHDPGVSVGDMERLGVQHVADLHELLRGADVVTLHVPLTASTRGMIDAAALAAMAPGAFLVNCARAALVDHEALGAALAGGRLGGCALDVLPEEPPAQDEPALRWPRTIVNPHAAWYSPRAAAMPYHRAGEAVAAVLRGEVPAHVIARPGSPTPCAGIACANDALNRAAE